MSYGPAAAARLIVKGHMVEPCEMGDEDGCDRPAPLLLVAPTSYVKPMRVCMHHAAEEAVYHGATLPDDLFLSDDETRVVAR